MMKKCWLRGVRYAIGLIAAAAILAPAVAQAQIRRVNPSESKQAIGFTIGYFVPKPVDSRVAGDTLVTDLDSLSFNIKDFNGATFGGEWLVGVGQFLEAGVGAGFYQRTVPSVYTGFTNTDGSEIAQDLKLRVIPMTATIRFLPIGRGAIQPYVGAGVGAFNWRYSESGQFVDFTDFSIFRNTYVASGTAIGPVILAGVRAPLGDAFMIGGEVRYQKADGDTKPATSQLLGNRIDLGGWTTNLTMHFRF
jgi:outer membrane protein W